MHRDREPRIRLLKTQMPMNVSLKSFPLFFFSAVSCAPAVVVEKAGKAAGPISTGRAHGRTCVRGLWEQI